MGRLFFGSNFAACFRVLKAFFTSPLSYRQDPISVCKELSNGLILRHFVRKYIALSYSQTALYVAPAKNKIS